MCDIENFEVYKNIFLVSLFFITTTPLYYALWKNWKAMDTFLDSEEQKAQREYENNK